MQQKQAFKKIKGIILSVNDSTFISEAVTYGALILPTLTIKQINKHESK